MPNQGQAGSKMVFLVCCLAKVSDGQLSCFHPRSLVIRFNQAIPVYTRMGSKALESPVFLSYNVHVLTMCNKET